MKCAKTNMRPMKLWDTLVLGFCAVAFFSTAPANAQGITQEAGQSKHHILNIQWLHFFDHEVLVSWPPSLPVEGKMQQITQKLSAYLKNRRPDIIITPLQRTTKDAESIKGLVERGKHAYEQLKHREAAQYFTDALNAYLRLGWHLVEPITVSEVHLLLGKTRLEEGHEGESERHFRKAYELQPGLRIREDFEHPNTIRVLKRARRSFLNRPPERARSVQRSNMPKAVVQIHGRLLQDRLELVINSASGTRLEMESLDAEIDVAIGRMMNRVLDCLPAKDTLNVTRTPPAPTVSIGMGIGTFYRSAVGAFPVYETRIGYIHRISPILDWWTGLQLSSTGRDQAKHLRNAITSISLALGPRPRIRLFGIETIAFMVPWFERRSAHRISTNPACKYFSASRPPPTALCDFDTDIQSFDADWSTGLMLGSSVRVPVNRQLAILWGLSLRFKLLEGSETRFQSLYGSDLSLGYRF